MRDLIFPVKHNSGVGLQTQLRRQLVDAIVDGRLSGDEPLPSCRRMAQSLGVSRNTVVLAYQALADEGLLISRERVGYFINAELAFDLAQAPEQKTENLEAPVDWEGRFQIRPSEQQHVAKPRDWTKYRYPFIYGQTDPSLFPVTAWRLCSRQALGISSIQDWSEDRFDQDDPRLIEEVRARVLPRRGIKASEDEILITLGAQNGIFLIAQLLAGPDTQIGFEDPGYVDARHIFQIVGGELKALPVDEHGLVVDGELDDCDCIYVTPSHQSPTTVTLPIERRNALLRKAEEKGILIIEDDYEAETNFVSAPTPALKSIDHNQRVIYLGSFSKYLAPGIRMGYMVASRELIREARFLRRLIMRHPPANNQRTLAYFIAGGYYDALVHRLQRGYRQRWEKLGDALEKHLPQTTRMKSQGGTSFWVTCPPEVDCDQLVMAARQHGLLIESGTDHYYADEAPKNHLRLGFSSIELSRIEPGIKLLAELMGQVASSGIGNRKKRA
ncbi:MAG: PLP-dependent aminotransferase family protein [Pseudomonadota bacterium]